METSMSTQENVRIVKDAFAAVGRGDKQGLLALSAEDIEWIVPGQEWPLAGTHRRHAGLADLVQKASEIVETSFPEPPEFVAQRDRVLVLGVSRGRVKATNKTFEDHFVFAITHPVVRSQHLLCSTPRRAQENTPTELGSPVQIP
jgi:ketosteroid isomerase-like protein